MREKKCKINARVKVNLASPPQAYALGGVVAEWSKVLIPVPCPLMV